MRLRVATLNAWTLPWRLAKDTAARVEAIGLRLGSLDCDLMLLQEVWTEGAAARLAAAGQAAGFSHVWRPAEARGGSGLLLLSRHALIEPRFERYLLPGLPHNLHHGDYHGGKGFLLARIDTPLGALAVVNTHLHAQYTRDGADIYRGHRTGQAVQLSAALRRVREPILAAGDYNLREGRPEYRVLVGISRLRDLAAELDQRADTVRRANPYQGRMRHSDQRIDFVFGRDGGEIAVRPVRVQRIFDEELALYGRRAAYSDHDGLLAEVNLERRAPQKLAPPEPEALELAEAMLATGRARARRRRRRQRLTAAGAVAAGTAALALRSRTTATRRSLLRRGLALVAGVSLPLAALNASLSEIYVPRELVDYEQMTAQIEALRAETSPHVGER